VHIYSNFLEISASEQGHCEICASWSTPRRATPRHRVPRVRRVSAVSYRRPTSPGAALLEAALFPRQRAFPRQARTARAAGVRATTCRACTSERSVLSVLPACRRSLPVVGPPSPYSLSLPPHGEHRATIKGGTARELASARRPYPSHSTGANKGGRGEPRYHHPRAPTAAPSTSLAPVVSRRLAHVPHQAAASPELSSRRTPHGRAAELPHRHDPDPNQAPKSSLGESLVVSPPFPRPPAPPVRRILAGTAALHGRGPNCVSLFLSREFYANQAHGCKSERLSRDPGAKPHLK
jgi:hypothetical protein